MYFYAFFRRGAFEDGPLSLENILKASAEFALRYVAQGFFEYKANGLTPSPETNKQIYDNSLILLYRLLFLLYAEARDLLPLQENTRYRRLYSLEAIKKEYHTLHSIVECFGIRRINIMNLNLREISNSIGMSCVSL